MRTGRMTALLALFLSGCSLARGALGSGRDAAADAEGVDVGMLDAATADVGLDAPLACSDGMQRCSSDLGSLERCVGGAWQSGVCALGCLEGPPHCGVMTPANVATRQMPGTAEVVLDASGTIDTDACTGVAGVSGRVVPQDGGGPDVCLLEVASFRVAAGASVAVVGSHPLIVVSQGAIDIAGTLDASSYADHAGAGSGTGGSVGGAGIAGMPGSPGDGGGGGGGFGALGGAGAGDAAGATGGAPGARVDSQLSPLVGGAAGGSGSGTTANGGRGGGAIQLTSMTEVRITGTVEAGGGGGGGGAVYFGGAGGGSGGGVLLEAPRVTLGAGPSPSVLVAGGGGGSGGCATTTMQGARGADGASAGAGRATGAPAPCAVTMAGGLGGGGDVAAGGAPGAGTPGSNGAGGGGAAGWIIFHTRDGQVPAGLTNPSAQSVFASELAVD